MVLLEESPEQVLRDMRSIGLDLRPWVEAGLLGSGRRGRPRSGWRLTWAVLAGLIEEESAGGGGARRDREPVHRAQ